MGNPRRLLFTLALVLLVIYTSWEMGTEERPMGNKTHQPRHAPDFWLEDFTLTNLNEHGLPKSRIHATRMTHYRDDDSSEIVDMHFESYKDTRPPIIMASPDAWLNADGNIILMKGAVHISRDAYDTRSWLKIDTHDLWLFTEQDYAQSDYLAVIRTQDLIKRGVGLEAWTEKDHFKLHAEVKNRHERKGPPLTPADLVGTDTVYDQSGPIDG